MITQRKNLRQFHHELSWSTRIFVLMAVAVAIGAHLFPSWTLTVAVALAVVLLVESLTLSIQHHPATWRTIGWLLLLTLLTLLLTGGAA